LNYDKELTQIINRVSNINMIEPEMTKMMIEHFFKDSILNMKKNGKDLMIHSFGTFEKNKARIAGAKKTVKYQKLSDLEKEYFENIEFIVNQPKRRDRRRKNK